MGGGCGREDSDEQKAAISGGYCPLYGDAETGEVRIAGFGVAPTSSGTEIRFAARGRHIAAYRVYRDEHEDQEAVLVAQGAASADRLMRVVDGEAVASGYTVEVVDVLGRVTRAVLVAGSPQVAEIATRTAVPIADGVGDA